MMPARRVRLAEAIRVAEGLVDPTIDPYRSMPHIGGENIESATGRLIGVASAEALGLKSGKYPFWPGDVLYSKIRPALNKVAAVTFEGICSADVYPLRCHEDVVAPEYLVYLLRSRGFLAYADKHSTRTNIPKVNREALLGYEVDLPPLPEQRRIAALLDKADAIRRKRQQAIHLANDFLPSLFVNVFGDPVANPRGWPTTPLGDVLESIEAGWSAVGDDRPRKPDELAVLKISAVTSGFFRPEEAKVVDTPIESRVLITPRRGDVLFSRANTRELVAATCLVDRDYPSLFLPDKLWRITPKRDRFTGEYLRFVLANERFRGEICRRATGTSGSMLNVSQDKVISLRAPVPPLELQAGFAAAVWRWFSLRENLAHTEAAAEMQLEALAQFAFR